MVELGELVELQTGFNVECVRTAGLGTGGRVSTSRAYELGACGDEYVLCRHREQGAANLMLLAGCGLEDRARGRRSHVDRYPVNK